MTHPPSLTASNAELSRIFDRIADLLEIDGADRFRVNSYRRVSRTLSETSENAHELAAEGKLIELPGVGKGAAERIQQYLTTGHIDVLDELQAKLPAGLLDLLEIPGLGPKRIAQVHRELAVNGLDDLRRVIQSGQLAELSGFGAASVKKIVDGMAFLETKGGRTRLGEALPIAEAILEWVSKQPQVRRAAIAGSLRRGMETIGDVDIVCETAESEEVIKSFVSMDGVRRVLASGSTKGSITVDTPGGHELQIDLRAVEHDSFGAALQYFTGSKEHNVRLREMAVKKKWRLNEYGLFDGEKSLAGLTEEQIYKKLGLPWIPPELRQDRGEFDADFELPDLVTLEDIRGDLHMHTTASDGRNSIEEMALAAKKRGYKFIAICDHSKSATIANGLSVERMREHIKAIRKANANVDGIEILAGCECDILPDGSMDYPDDLLAECDWVVASIHTAMGPGGSGKRSPTERTLAAMDNRWVCAIGHPTGRLINKRAAMEIDIGTVIEHAKRTGTFLEINASYQRLDLKDLHVHQAVRAGVMLTMNTDAHSTEGLGAMRYGVMTARRGWAKKSDILNCCTLAALRKKIAAKRG